MNKKPKGKATEQSCSEGSSEQSSKDIISICGVDDIDKVEMEAEKENISYWFSFDTTHMNWRN